jgi:hypothetical protein
MPSELIHCIYASAVSRDFETEELEELLQVARENNAKLGLTGMLLYAEGSFFQVLEGPADVVDALYVKIKRDKRHDNVSREELAGILGVNNFFRNAGAVECYDAGRARKLLAAFSEGRWQQKLAGARLTGVNKLTQPK